ncbi:siderophore-interacting protein [Burkholderia pseudomallei]|nr:siderophore-interacting protein [Burkholderia pseudomallei]
MTQPTTERAVVRVRHTLKFRLLQVKRVVDVTPHLKRVTLAGDELDDFESASFDDHVKVFFPPPGEDAPARPEFGPNGIVFPQDRPRPVARDFTPRRYDRAARELDLDFVLHHPGPASQWAAQARVGQTLGIGGPRGSFVIPKDFDWHLLIGDDTALPAVARRLEELPAGTRVAAVLEVADPSAQIAFETDANLYVVWRHRGDAAMRRAASAARAGWSTHCANCRCRRAKATYGRRARRPRCAACASICAASAASRNRGFAHPLTGSTVRSPCTNRSKTDPRPAAARANIARRFTRAIQAHGVAGTRMPHCNARDSGRQAAHARTPRPAIAESENRKPLHAAATFAASRFRRFV